MSIYHIFRTTNVRELSVVGQLFLIRIGTVGHNYYIALIDVYQIQIVRFAYIVGTSYKHMNTLLYLR